jgi:DamX protein
MASVANEKPLTPVTGQASTAAVHAAPEPTAVTSDKETVQRSDAQSPATDPTLETAAEPAAASEQLPHRENWLLAQPGTSYSLQLLGSRNAESITRYIQQQQLDIQQSAIYKGMYKGAEWYVLLYGIYPSLQAATEARDTLPAAVRSDKPWPRTLKTVHSAIREVQ